MALTARELDIANQIKAQGWTREDFMDILGQIRSKQPEPQIEQPIAIESEKLEVATPREQSLSLAPVEAEDIEDIALDIPQTSKEIEQEEGLKGFVSETWEALKQRWANIAETIWRLDEKTIEGREKISKTIKDKWLWAWFLESMKQELNQLGSSFQTAWQVVAWGLDVVWEWLENTIQDATPEVVEKAIENTVAKIGESKTVQEVAESYSKFRENKPELARNIEAAVNIGQILPVTKVWKVVTKPVSKSAQQAVKKGAEQQLKNTSRAILNLPTKTTWKETLQVGKFFADKVKPTNSFDNMTTQFDNIANSSIKQVNDSLWSVTKTFKPQGAKEVLKEMVNNSKKIQFSTAKTNKLNSLLKKVDTDGLTLSEINSIKRSINDYVKGWTTSGLEGAGLKANSIRGKYSEVMKFIENAAKREWLPDIRQLNKDWFQSNQLSELLTKQATTIGKKQWMQSLQGQSIIKKLGSSIRQGRENLGLSDMIGSVWLEDLDLKKALETIKKISKGTEAQTLQSKIAGSAVWKATIAKMRTKWAELLDDFADKTGARSKFIQNTGKSLDEFDFSEAGKRNIQQFKDEINAGLHDDLIRDVLQVGNRAETKILKGIK